MDYLNDSSVRYLHRLNNLLTVPDYVKAASVSPEDHVKLANFCFADAANKEYPIHTKGATYLSHYYYQVTRQDNSQLAARIKQAAFKHGILADLEVLDNALKKETPMNKAASTGPRYAVYVDFGSPDPKADKPWRRNGGIQGFYPCNNSTEIEDSSVKLANDFRKLPLPTFVEGSRNLIKAASETATDTAGLPRVIRFYGEERVPDFDRIEEFAEKRASATGNSVYRDIAAAAKADQGRPLDDYVQLWEEADTMLKVACSEGEPDAYRIFYSGMTKQAHLDILSSLVTIADVPVPLDAVRNINEQLPSRYFAKEAATRLVNVIKMSKALSGPDLGNLVQQTINEAEQKAFLNLVVRHA